MKVICEFRGNRLWFISERENSDSPLDGRCGNVECYVDMPFSDINKIHPDHLGLATILLFNPFIGEELYLPCEVSRDFYESVKHVLSKYIISSGYSEKIKKYSSSEKSKPGLAFSGGQDSMAALSLMPENTVCIFLDRPMNQNSSYDSDAAYMACESLSQIGYDVRKVESDLEYLRNPVGFPSDLANGVPIILLANYLDIDSIGYGTVLESTYGIGHKEFRDYPNKPHHRFYGDIFKSAGLEKNFPVGGISEVGTSLINMKSSIGKMSQSCIRGVWKIPCHKCWKCFRKDLLGAALYNNKNEVDLKIGLNQKEVQINLMKIPISHENVLMYSLKNIDIGEYKFLEELKNRVDRDINIDFLERWYAPSLVLIPDKYKIFIRDKNLHFMPAMNNSQEVGVVIWNMIEFMENKITISNKNILVSSWDQ